jgi:hypothetical protein
MSEEVENLRSKYNPQMVEQIVNDVDECPKKLSKLAWMRLHKKKTLLILVLVTFLIYLIISGNMKIALENFSALLDHLFVHHPILGYLLVYVFILTVVFFCYLSHTTACLMVSLSLKDFALSFGILLSATILAESLIYFYSVRVFKSTVVSLLKNVKVINILTEESQKRPYRTAFITRFLMFPMGIKAYLLTFIGNNPKSYFLSGITIHSINIAKAYFMAFQVAEFKAMLFEGKKWSEKSLEDKVIFFVILFLFVAGGVAVIAVGVWAAKKMKKATKKHDRDDIIEMKATGQ